MSSNIESSGLPLVFRVPSNIINTPTSSDTETGLRVYVRALEGMQKEAIVGMASPSGPHIWRMVCDEGPYLNGTDLAPFPLAFFTAGTQFALMSEILQHSRSMDIEIRSFELIQDNYYTMDGSALQGTMIGGAKSPEVKLKMESNASADKMREVVRRAKQSSAALAIFETVLENTFALTFNDERLSTGNLRSWNNPVPNNVSEVFDSVKPDDNTSIRDDIITRLSAAEAIEGVEGGAGSSLRAEQKRTLHVHGEAEWTSGMQMETTIQLLKPLGSVFRFVCDEVAAAGGNESAPPPLAYLSAGVGFCFMTQVGRYAQITRQSLHSYQIIQHNRFVHNGTYENGSRSVQARPMNTHLYLEADELNEIAQETLYMSERTCFLHAAMRGSIPVVIEIELNGNLL